MDSATPSYSHPDPHAMAIVGMSISAPGGEARGLDVQDFYTFLQKRGSGIVVVPKDRWNAEAFRGTGPGQICTTKGGFIPDFAYGDLQEFGITPTEASQIAISQMVLLHQAFNALQRSGIDYRGTRTGVYVGCAAGSAPYQTDIVDAGAYYMTGTSLSINANRINYVFDLLGPSMPVDTACSSALTAMHLATQAIRNGECEQAVVAGVNFVAAPLETAAFSQLGVLSPDGISKSFDEDANGYARADVASAIVIKRHDLAVKDFDRIHATLVGTALTSCGSIMGSLTTPNPDAQAQVIRMAYADAGLQPHQADFVELHGTGTVVGDSYEANTAGKVFSDGRNGRDIVIGSVKSNVGHGEMGAYMTSLVKVVMMLEKKQILPNGFFQKPSSRIDFQTYKLRVPLIVENFIPQDPRLGLVASISSFGFGGSCGHTVLREHEARPVHIDGDTLREGPFLYAIGGLTPTGCSTLVDLYKKQHGETAPLALCEHIGSRARQMPWRTYAIASSLQTASFPDPALVPKRANPIVFCFSGQGPQHWDQGRDFFAAYSTFRESILDCDLAYQVYTGKSFLEETGLFTDRHSASSPLSRDGIWSASVTSIGINFFQIALFDLLSSFGIKPDAVVGHSVGETAVLYASGAMPRHMAVKISIARGRALDSTSKMGGGMVAISGRRSVQDYIKAVIALAELDEKCSEGLHLASFNSPIDIGVSGSEKLIEMLINVIERWGMGVSARKLRVSTAPHSPFVDGCEDQYRCDLEAIFAEYPGPHSPSRPTMSTVTGLFKDDAYTIDYLWKNIRQPVLFSTAIPGLLGRFGNNTTFLELSPHPVLSQYIKRMGAFDSLACSIRPPSMEPSGATPQGALRTLLNSIGRLLMYGVNSINFAVLNGHPQSQVEAPAYPFQWKVRPAGEPEPTYLRKLLPRERPLNSKRLRISPNLPEPWISHHVINHSNLVPAAAYIEMALEFPDVTHLWDCSFVAAYILEESAPPATLEVAIDGNQWFVRSSSMLRNMHGDLEWTRTGPNFDITHACGKLGYGKPDVGGGALRHVDVDKVLSRCTQTHTKEALYSTLEGVFQFGPEFKRINSISVNETEAISRIRGHVDGMNCADYIFHPAIIDAVFQSPIGWTMMYDRISVSRGDALYLLPHSLRRAFRNDGTTTSITLPAEFIAYSVLTSWSINHWTINCYVLDEHNDVLFTFEGLHFKSVSQNRSWPTERYEIYWQPRSLPQSNLGNDSLLTRSMTEVESVQVLQSLDKYAFQYITKALASLPSVSELSTVDRKDYLTWCQSVSLKNTLQDGSCADLASGACEKYACLMELTRRVGEGLNGIIRSSMFAVEILFRDDIMHKVYEQPPFTGRIFDKMTSNAVELVRFAQNAGKRVIRILEVGAGTGRLTAHLGHALLTAGLMDDCYIEYVCSDVSMYLAQQATARSPLTSVTPSVFDINAPLAIQELDPASFDIILAFDVLHAASDIPFTLSTLRDLLLPGGHIAVIELDGRSFASGATGTLWMDFVFGSFQEWRGFTDHRRDTKHCTLQPAEWRTSLESAGFAHTMICASEGYEHVVSHIAFVSQANSQTYSSPSPTSSLIMNSSLEGATSPAIAYTDPADPAISWTILPFKSGEEATLVHTLSHLDDTAQLNVWLHTCTIDENMALVGLVRSIRHEFPLWKIYLALFAASWTPDQQHSFVLSCLVPLRWVDAEVMIDASGNMYVPRIVRAPQPPQLAPRSSIPIQFDDTHVWQAYPLPLGPNGVEISVSYINLSSALPWTEFSGEVVAMGSNVTDLTVGQRVCGFAAHTPSSVIVCDRASLLLIPETLDTSISTVLVGRLAFLATTILPYIPPSSTGVKVMLHAGECLPAAIATHDFLIARGFETMITLRTPTSRPIPFEIPPTLCYDSRNYQMWTFKTRLWAPEGVQVVFNFDEDMNVARESATLVSPKGTLVQIGSDLPQSLPRGRHYISVDTHDIIDNPVTFLTATDLLPLLATASSVSSFQVYALSEHSSAYLKARSGSGTDTAVLVNVKEVDTQLPILRGGIIKGTTVFDPRAVYVILGGIGGIGVSIAHCLVENGAQHIVLTSRSGEKAFADGKLVQEKKIINSLRDIPGVTIDITAVDCLDAEKMRDLFDSLAYPLAGVFYMPVVLNDQRFSNLGSDADWKIVYDVKIAGLRILLQVVDPRSLDFLVLGSSMATVSGSPGQANYAAAQTAMEAIGSSLPNTVSVAIPPVLDGGIFVRRMRTGNRGALDKYMSIGVSGRQVAEMCVDAIWTLNSKRNHARNTLYIPSCDWAKVIQLGTPSSYASLTRHLMARNHGALTTATDSGEPRMGSVLDECAKALSLNAQDISETVPLASYGLDSLTSVRLSGILKTKFGIVVSQLQLLGSHMTVERLVKLWQESQAKTLATNVPPSSLETAEKPKESPPDTHIPTLDHTLVRLNNVTHKSPPLFIFHGAGGGVLVLLKFAQKLSYPVIGVQDTLAAPIFGTFDQLCQFYLSKIRERQPGGPYRLGGFSFGACLAFGAAKLLRQVGETVELLLMLDAAPTILSEHAKIKIAQSTLQDEILTAVRDMCSSGALDYDDGVASLPAQFEDHLHKISQGGIGGPKWIARFCTAYAAHMVMSVQAGAAVSFDLDIDRLGNGVVRGGDDNEMTEKNDVGWPAERTVLVRAQDGIGARESDEDVGSGEKEDQNEFKSLGAFGLEKYDPDVEVREVRGTHFGMLSPESGLVDILTEVLCGQSERMYGYI